MFGLRNGRIDHVRTRESVLFYFDPRILCFTLLKSCSPCSGFSQITVLRNRGSGSALLLEENCERRLSRPRNSEQFQPADKLELPWFMVVKYTDAGVR